MKEKIKEFSKKYLIGFILGLITTLSISVIAATYFPSNDVTYDNTASGLQSTNVQGAIDELYGVCFPSVGDQIIEDGELEKDPYECRYFFTGANPNNYVTFNGETAGWRIISVECDGRIKIVKEDDINTNETIQWDTLVSNNWARPAALNTYLNSTYYNSLNSTAKDKIVVSDFSIGAVTVNNDDLEDQINDENSVKWSGKIALPTVSEYLRINSNKDKCGTFKLNLTSKVCASTCWAKITNLIGGWTLSPQANSSTAVLFISRHGEIGNGGGYSYAGNDYLAVNPSLYLSSDIKITGGIGTKANPYIIE